VSDEVLLERWGRVLVITLNRPEAKNAINIELSQQLCAAIDLLDADPELSVGVLTGAAGTFCAGMDLKAFLRGERPRIPGRGLGGMTQTPPRKPIIAAVEGWALAGGCELALACDLITAGSGAKFGIPEVKRGLVAAAGGLFRLGRKIPLNVAMELALTGDPISADLAHHHGLVNRLCEPGQALEVATGLAEQICANAPVAVRESRKVVIEATNAPDEIGWKMSLEALAAAMSSEDFGEGLTAFIEKRPPQWKGR
jgi:enoyl-CoA hydratase